MSQTPKRKENSGEDLDERKSRKIKMSQTPKRKENSGEDLDERKSRKIKMSQTPKRKENSGEDLDERKSRKVETDIDEQPVPTNSRKSDMRTNYLSKDDYYMAIAFLSAKRSKDPVTQVGACIVNSEDRVVGIGYNGMPNGCPDDQMPWGKEGLDLDTKKFYVCHAEMNAIVNKYQADLKSSNTRMYVSLFPCNESAKIIVQSGIKEVIYYSDKKKEKPEFEASRILFEHAGITPRPHKPANINIDFSSIEK